MAGLKSAIIGSFAIAAVSTLGDFIWAMWIPRHRGIYGLSHGTLLFLCIGLFLGIVAKRPLRGMVVGAVTGFLAAGSFYVLSLLMGYSAMFFVWFAIWIGLAAFMKSPVQRGFIAAILSGLAFYLVSGIWFPFRPRGWDYLYHFVAWSIAYFPGFAALLLRRNDVPSGT